MGRWPISFGREKVATTIEAQHFPLFAEIFPLSGSRGPAKVWLKVGVGVAGPGVLKVC